MSGRVRIESRRFGPIDASQSDFLHCDGIPGFPAARRFLLLRHDRDSAFAWLVCAEDPELAFVVTDPWNFIPDYRPELELRHLRSVEADPGTSVEVLVIVDVRGGEIRLNLAAPLLVNAERRRAAQVILERGEHPIRCVVAPPAAAAGPA